MLQATAENFVQTVEVTPDKSTRKTTVPENKIQKKTNESAPLINFSDDDEEQSVTSPSLQQGVGESKNSNDRASTLLDATFQIETVATLVPTKADMPSTDTQQMPLAQLNADANESVNTSSQMANVDKQNEVPKDCVVSMAPVKDCGSLTATVDIMAPANSALAPPKSTKRLKKPKISFDTKRVTRSKFLIALKSQ